MNNSLNTDFQSFIDSRLDYVDSILKNDTDYQQKRVNVKWATEKLFTAMPAELSSIFTDIDDGNMELENIALRVSYRQGFLDAVRLLSEKG